MSDIDGAMALAEEALADVAGFRERNPQNVVVADYLEEHRSAQIARALLALRPVWEAAQAWRGSSRSSADDILCSAIDAARRDQIARVVGSESTTVRSPEAADGQPVSGEG